MSAQVLLDHCPLTHPFSTGLRGGGGAVQRRAVCAPAGGDERHDVLLRQRGPLRHQLQDTQAQVAHLPRPQQLDLGKSRIYCMYRKGQKVQVIMLHKERKENDKRGRCKFTSYIRQHSVGY